MGTTDLDQVRVALAELTELHGWAGLQTPRNMALALTAHVGAVAGHLQFVSDGDADWAASDDLRAELADCLVYLVALTDAVHLDIADEAVRRLRAATTADRERLTAR